MIKNVVDCSLESSDDATVTIPAQALCQGDTKGLSRYGNTMLSRARRSTSNLNELPRKCLVKIPYRMGLMGHSDADVVCHAVINAVLGAMAEGDIGMHFPDTDPRYQGIASIKMLDTVLRIMRH